MPRNLDTTRQHAAIVVGHPMGAVKEQSANVYATQLHAFFQQYLDVAAN